MPQKNDKIIRLLSLYADASKEVEESASKIESTLAKTISSLKNNCNASTEHVQHYMSYIPSIKKDELIPIGFLRREINIHGTKADDALFKIMPSYGFRPIMFTLDDINIDGTIRGQTLTNGKTTGITVKIPQIIDSYNVNYSNQPEHIKRILNCCHLTRGLQTNKYKTHELLKKDGRFKDILISTTLVTKFEDIINALEGEDIILKAASGNQGRQVIKLSKTGKKYTIMHKTTTRTISLEELEQYFYENINGTRYLIQSYIDSTTKDGEPFDIRIEARRGQDGKFAINLLPRIGNPATCISNMGSSGYTMPVETFLRKNFPDSQKQILEKFNRLASEFPDYYTNLFKEANFFDIGLDVGICRHSGRLALFEVNTFIGCNITGLYSVHAACNYYKYLYEKLYTLAN